MCSYIISCGDVGVVACVYVFYYDGVVGGAVDVDVGRVISL